MSTQNSPASEIAELGCLLAMIISWSANKSILWAILHGVFGWFYVIYYALGEGR